jgi:FAD/FMN-containing dehydrogenase
LRAIGKPAVDGVVVQDYKVLQTHEDATVAHGIRSYAKNAMVGEFSQGLVDDLIDSFIEDPRAALFTHTCGGAVGDAGSTDTAFPHRDVATMFVFFTGWMDPAQDAEGKQLCRDWHAALEKYSLGYYDNIEQDGDARVARNFGPNYERLRQVKAQYDPGNQFRLNSNIEPAAS